MVRSVSADDLLRNVREAAGMCNVRAAVRDITLHALRSRLLSATHIAIVARTVGEGIASSDIAPTAPVRESNRSAWAGLEDAVGQALHAVELAAKEIVEGRARFSPAEREQALDEIAQLERSLAEGWGCPHVVPTSLHARIAAVTALLRQPCAAAASGSPDCATGPGVVLSLVASGVLVGLSEDPREGAG